MMPTLYSIFVLALLFPALAGGAFFPDAIPIENIGEPRTLQSELKGAPERYTFTLRAPQTFYANLLVPNAERQRKDFLIEVISERGARYAMNGAYFFKWVPMTGPDGTSYLKGPEIAPTLYPGNYSISVSNADNHGAYVLIVSNGSGATDIPKNAAAALFITKIKPIVAATGISVAALTIALCVKRHLRKKHNAPIKQGSST